MNYPGNSHRSRDVPETSDEPAKKIDPVVNGTVVRRKKPIGKRMRDTFIGGDSRSVWSYVVLDVLVPATKDMAVDAMSQFVERLFYGDSRPSTRRPGQRSAPSSYVSYNRMTGPMSSRPEPRTVSSRGRATHDFDEIILESRREADEVLDKLFELVSKYELATVADLYELVGITAAYTDGKWGWSDLRGAGVTKIRGGYLLDLPRPEPVN